MFTSTDAYWLRRFMCGFVRGNVLSEVSKPTRSFLEFAVDEIEQRQDWDRETKQSVRSIALGSFLMKLDASVVSNLYKMMGRDDPLDQSPELTCSSIENPDSTPVGGVEKGFSTAQDFSMPDYSKLSDILPDGGADLKKMWDQTDAADSFEPLPPGTYTCATVDGGLKTAKSGTVGYSITFEVIDGPHCGRKIWTDFWLTAAALPRTKAALSKLGMTHDGLDGPPPDLVVTALVTRQQRDDGTQFNQVRSFTVQQPEADGPSGG